MRPAPLISDAYYHIYCRGVDKRTIFLQPGHYRRFIETIQRILDTGSATPRLKYNQGLALNHKIDLLCYCLMPNHYHLLIKQKEDNGITQFMHKLNTSYAMFLNLNSHRKGRLLETTFKAKLIDSDELLLHISRYIHINPILAGLSVRPEIYEWSSFREYVREITNPLCNTSTILDYFPNDPKKSYEQFVQNQVTYAQLLNEAKNLRDGEDSLFL